MIFVVSVISSKDAGRRWWTNTESHVTLKLKIWYVNLLKRCHTTQDQHSDPETRKILIKKKKRTKEAPVRTKTCGHIRLDCWAVHNLSEKRNTWRWQAWNTLIWKKSLPCIRHSCVRHTVQMELVALVYINRWEKKDQRTASDCKLHVSRRHHRRSWVICGEWCH